MVESARDKVAEFRALQVDHTGTGYDFSEEVLNFIREAPYEEAEAMLYQYGRYVDGDSGYGVWDWWTEDGQVDNAAP